MIWRARLLKYSILFFIKEVLEDDSKSRKTGFHVIFGVIKTNAKAGSQSDHNINEHFPN